MDEDQGKVKLHPYVEVLSDPVYGAIGVVPPPEDASLWRFMSLAKFLSMLETSKLYLARIDRFEDKFEGTLPQQTSDAWAEVMDAVEKAIDGQIASGSLPAPSVPQKSLWQSLRERTYINCWYMSEYESDGMWKLYASGNVAETVGIRTSAIELLNSIPDRQHRLFLGKVNYVDFHANESALGLLPSPLSGFFVKRNAFEHEKEVRLLIQPHIGPSAIADKASAFGKSLAIDLPALIKQIVVAPGSPDWFYELVKSLLTRYGLDANLVTRSSLDRRPTATL